MPAWPIFLRPMSRSVAYRSSEVKMAAPERVFDFMTLTRKRTHFFRVDPKQNCGCVRRREGRLTALPWRSARQPSPIFDRRSVGRCYARFCWHIPMLGGRSCEKGQMHIIRGRCINSQLLVRRTAQFLPSENRSQQAVDEFARELNRLNELGRDSLHGLTQRWRRNGRQTSAAASSAMIDSVGQSD